MLFRSFVRFQARLKKPHNFQNPGGFDYERYLRWRRILISGFISEPSGIVLLRKRQGNPLRLQLEDIRSRIRQTLRDKVPGDEGRVIQAMILGEKKEIPGEIIEAFNKTGTSHIIAISGLHVGIVAFVCLVTIRWLLGRSEYLLLRWNVAKMASLAAMIAVLCYMGIAGLGISVIRATIMVLTFKIGRAHV